MKSILTVVGTRPEAIKLAPLIRELEKHPDRVRSMVCVTAQHREMLDQVMDIFGIEPDHDLDLMREGQSPTQVAARVLTDLERILDEERPDWVLVQGDTTTVMSAAIAAFYRQVKVGHVEAGLRTHDKTQPFPEEVNRRIAGVVADLHFAPTETSRRNLLRENVPDESVFVTGNTVIDALHWISERELTADDRRSLATMGLEGFLDGEASPRRGILVTAHRRENHGAPLEEICLAVKELAELYGDEVQIAYPVHLNPKVQEPAYRILSDLPNVVLAPPLDYLPLVHIMKQCDIVLTDSGGLQEEAPGLGKPVLVLRETTERPEGIEAGTVKLVGTDRDVIVRETRRLMEDEAAYDAMATAVNPYGDGQASRRIVDAILRYGAEGPGEPPEEAGQLDRERVAPAGRSPEP